MIHENLNGKFIAIGYGKRSSDCLKTNIPECEGI